MLFDQLKPHWRIDIVIMTFLNVTSWRHVIVYSALITALSVMVPVLVVSIVLREWTFQLQVPALMIAGAIPFFIALPISVFALNLLRTMNDVMAKMDSVVRFDGMTGLLNRTHFFHLLAEQRNHKALFAIVDADHFKLINDRFGHDCGDETLKYLAQNLSQVFGPYGLVCRLGGEEFGLYLPHVSIEQMRLLVATLQSGLVAHPFEYEGVELAVSVSIGAAMDDVASVISAVSKKADACLYAAKNAGRNRCFYANAIDEVAQLAA